MRFDHYESDHLTIPRNQVVNVAKFFEFLLIVGKDQHQLRICLIICKRINLDETRKRRLTLMLTLILLDYSHVCTGISKYRIAFRAEHRHGTPEVDLLLRWNWCRSHITIFVAVTEDVTNANVVVVRLRR
jgi:hypothetical protein